ncbi:MAG: pectate lyase, partial [Microbispora sp.]|nr:pectate lyase [Microbispora sp.]
MRARSLLLPAVLAITAAVPALGAAPASAAAPPSGTPAAGHAGAGKPVDLGRQTLPPGDGWASAGTGTT